MVSLKAIRAANGALVSQSLTAVFVGATSGIGLGAIQALLESTASSKVYIIGRSQSKFAPTLVQLQALDPSATLVFIEAQVSLLHEVARVCNTVAAQESSLDILWLSQGGLSLRAHALSSEGIFDDFAVKYYSRVLFMHRLAPLLSASSDGRVLSILSAGSEGPLDLSDPGMQSSLNYGFFKAQRQGVTMMSLAMHQLALLHPAVSFLHTNPGMVSTDVHAKWADTMTGAWAPLAWAMRWALIPLMHSLGYTPQDAGRTGLYEATDSRYSARPGRNFFRVWQDGELVETWGRAAMTKYDTDTTRETLWEHTVGVFDRVLQA